MSRRGVAMLGESGRGSPFSGRLRRGGVAGPVLRLKAMMERRLMLGVGNALGVNRRVHVRRRLAPSALVDHWDGDVTGLETGAAGPRWLVMGGHVDLQNKIKRKIQFVANATS